MLFATLSNFSYLIFHDTRPTQTYASLPHNGIGDAGIDAQGTKERSGVLDSWGFGTEKHAEANDPEERGADVAQATLTSAIRDVTDCNCQNSGGSIRRHWE